MNKFYPINEVFISHQGEATFTGTPSIFIRFQGCNVGCPWCDTKNTWIIDNYNKLSFEQIIAKKSNDNSFAFASLNEIISFIKSNTHIFHVVITGGEPLLYNLYPLCNTIETMNKTIQIETSGTSALSISKNTWLTLSPKIDMPNNKPILKEVVYRANEIKMPIGKLSDIEKLKNFIKFYNIQKDIAIWLQPLSQNKKALNICIEESLKNNWKLSIQTHKYINIR